MPGMDGLGLLRALRAEHRIILSTRAGDESKVEGLDAGADDYLDAASIIVARRIEAEARQRAEKALRWFADF